MKRISILLIPAMLSLMAGEATKVSRDHDTNPESYYLTVNEVPSSVALLPEVPDSLSARFAYDFEQYEWGKSLRDTERGRRAVMDANLDADWLDRCFGEAFGVPLTRENAPEIYRLLNNMREDAGDLATREAKNHYMRRRPFMVFGEHTSTPWDEDHLRNSGSYPSGHTAIGWASAIVLSELNPSRATEILRRGYDMGQSRVIVGAHFQSDVDAGRVVGSAIIGLLHASPEFQKQLEAAKQEAAKLLNN